MSRWVDYSVRKCCKCGSDSTSYWRRYYDEKGNWDRKSYICNKCYTKIQNDLPNSYNNARKIVCNCRTGHYIDDDRYKGRICENVVAIILELKNYNDILDNYNAPFDLSTHHLYGRISVKGRALNGRDMWEITFRDSEMKTDNFDTLIFLCIDKGWKNIDRVYIIPRSYIYTGIEVLLSLRIHYRQEVHLNMISLELTKRNITIYILV